MREWCPLCEEELTKKALPQDVRALFFDQGKCLADFYLDRFRLVGFRFWDP